MSIGEGQTNSQPFIVGFMTEALHLKKDDKVLEIGTGSGYQAVVLFELSRHVYSIEIKPELCRLAEENLKAAGLKPALQQQSPIDAERSVAPPGQAV